MNNAEKFRTVARPVGFVLCTLTLCILGVAASVGAADPPGWVVPLLATSWEWPIERTVRKIIGKE